MSGDQRPTRLTIRPRLGVSFRLLDAGLREVGRGTDVLGIDLSPGLYLVEWRTAGSLSESFVRIEPDGPESMEVRFLPAPGEQSDDRAANDSASLPTLPRADVVALVGTALRPSERAYDSSVAIVVSADGDLSPSEAMTDARLYNRDDVKMRANRDDVPAFGLGPGEYARCYRVRPGRYHLRFRSVTGDELAQTVPALAGRQTIVFLKAARANLLVASGERFVREEGVGIDASKSVAITVGGGESETRIRERIRLAGVLLHDLVVGTGSLSAGFVRVLSEPETDPLLRLYAAVVVQSCIELGTSPAIDNVLPDAESDREPAVRAWVEHMASWLGEPGEPGMPVDATTLRWRLLKAHDGFVQRLGGSAIPTRIEMPPMLERSWRWAISESIDRPGAVPSTPSVLAATRSAGGTTPWLCWKASAAKAAKGAEPRNMPRELSYLIMSVAAKADMLLSRARSSAAGGSDDLPADPLLALEPEIAAAALRTHQLVGADPETGLIADGRINRELEASLALSLSVPAGQLRRRLARTREDLDALLRDDRLADPRKDRASTAPGLARRPQYLDDPQRGRFGGTARNRGFSVSARFEETTSRNWARIVLRVRGNAADGTEVEFHLHDSFKPPLKTRIFKGGVAQLAVTAWGGFTVGVWIPSVGVELELNLATVRGAPRILRMR